MKIGLIALACEEAVSCLCLGHEFPAKTNLFGAVV
jgi:hypothetical protein